MHSTLAIATVAAAVAAVSAQNCNPSYNVASSGECFTNCNINAGQDFVSGWTMDPASPNFLDSLKLMCIKGTSEYMAFMTKAGMCMAGCSDSQELFVNEFAGACQWYALHKDDVCGAESITEPVATTTAPPADTTTTAPSTNNASSVPSSGSSSSAPVAVSSSVPAASNNNTVPAISGASSPATSNAQSSASSSVDAASESQAHNAGNKLHIGGFAIAMVASAGYLAL